MQGLAELIPAAMLLVIGYVTDRVTAVVLLTIATGALGFCSAGFASTFLDISPYYAGILMGLSNFFSTIPGVLSPYFTGKILAQSDGKSPEESAATCVIFFLCTALIDSLVVLQLQVTVGGGGSSCRWRMVFFIAAAVFVLGYVVYFFGVRVDPLPELETSWDETECEDTALLLGESGGHAPSGFRNRKPKSGTA